MYKQIVIFFVLVFVLSGCTQTTVKEHVEQEEIVPTSSLQTEETNLVAIADEFDLPILSFHHVGPAPVGASKETKTWYVSEEKFENILKLLNEQGYQTLFATEAVALIAEGHLPEKSIVITFDDGAKDTLTYAFPLLQKYNMKATVFLMTHVRSKNWVNADDIHLMDESGLVEFQSHTKYHEYLTRAPAEKVRDELKGSKEYIEELLGKPVTVIAYPFGLYNDEVIAIAKELGYTAGLTIDRKTLQKKDDLFRLHRVIILEYTDVASLLIH
ncbi:polysaccharide deacetylase family protein [Patescibacteria group bacterium]|nr:polysaccharide deacetylase family protein [Patescibacteria group bacterium]MBU1721704.1 polysaccharide deacetylase family protein [Patescibacteria group bacterium]MBU1900831.1 polysaccharide deacetylase family protein [Patescibacteria group bacterium]